MFTFQRKGAVMFAVSDQIGVPHGFSTRMGGVSTLPHLASMNFTASTGDSDANVEENYRLFLSAVGLDAAGRISAHQIHSTRVRYVTEADRGRVFDDCDGFVTDRPGVALIAKTADCVPVLLADEQAGVVSAVHAGWRGTVGGIAPRAVEEMLRLGATLPNIRVAIGACIRDCCFEVQNDFTEAVTAMRGEAFASAYIHRRGESMFADLVGMNCALLEEIGISPDAIDRSDACTCCAPRIYHSHRATKGQRGAMAAVIGLAQKSE